MGQAGVVMPQMRPQVSEVLEKALTFSSKERGLLIDRLIESLDDSRAEDGVEEAWGQEIKQRVDEIRSGKAKMIPGAEIKRRLASRMRNADDWCSSASHFPSSTWMTLT
jgi:putative addiction module component (TIGR02574 family)